jgi:hypothetical protein
MQLLCRYRHRVVRFFAAFGKYQDTTQDRVGIARIECRDQRIVSTFQCRLDFVHVEGVGADVVGVVDGIDDQ